MRNAGGYVKLYRSMLDWQWYQDDACVRIMLHLLLTVNRETKEWKGQVVQPGQLITSMDRLADDLRLTRSTIRRALERMKASGEVTIQTNNHWTTLTLAKWGEYQEPNQPVSRQKADKKPTNGQPVNQPAATTEEVKKLRREEVTTSVVTTRMSFDQFREKCLSVHKENKILSDAEAKAFFEYWTEGHPETKPRYTEKDKFDVALRMRTWKSRINNGKPVEAVPAHLKDATRKPVAGWQPL